MAAPSAQTLPALLSKIRGILPPSIPKSAAYILPASTLTALGQPALLGPLFLHVTGYDAPHATRLPAEEARTISLHLRDMLLKEWTLIGIPLVITALASLGNAEKEAGLFPTDQSTYSNASWCKPSTDAPESSACALGSTSVLSQKFTSGVDISPGAEVTLRGTEHIQRLYRQHLPPIMATWGSHEADFRWLEESVIYGLFLSDHSVLSDLETSLVTISGIIAQGMKGPSLWHIRGLRRLGVSKEDVEAVVRVVAECTAWAGGRAKGATGEEGEMGQWVGWVAEVEGEV